MIKFTKGALLAVFVGSTAACATTQVHQGLIESNCIDATITTKGERVVDAEYDWTGGSEMCARHKALAMGVATGAPDKIELARSYYEGLEDPAVKQNFVDTLGQYRLTLDALARRCEEIRETSAGLRLLRCPTTGTTPQ